MTLNPDSDSTYFDPSTRFLAFMPTLMLVLDPYLLVPLSVRNHAAMPHRLNAPMFPYYRLPSAAAVYRALLPRLLFA